MKKLRLIMQSEMTVRALLYATKEQVYERKNATLWWWCCHGAAFMCRKRSGNGGCSLWLRLRQVNRSQRWFVWQSGCCLDVLNASRASIHPQACVFDELLAGYGDTCSRASWQTYLSPSLTPQACVTSRGKNMKEIKAPIS